MPGRHLAAVDLKRVGPIDFRRAQTARDLVPNALPVTMIEEGKIADANAAIASWRWDVASGNDFSVNLAAALCAAQRAGHAHLLFDLVTVDQHSDVMIEQVGALSRLFSNLPVFAAYDREGATDWLPTMRRPWLFFESRAFHENGSIITYVAHQRDQGDHSFGFRHMLDRVWSTNYTTTVLLVLFGLIGIGKLADFAHIIPGHRNLLMNVSQDLSRNDYLLTIAILCQVFDADGRFHAGSTDSRLDLTAVEFDRYSLVPTNGPDRIYDYYAILLDGVRVATFYGRMKLDRDTMEPRYVRYLIAEKGAGEAIHRILDQLTLDSYVRDKPGLASRFALKAGKPGENIRMLSFADA